MTKKEKRLIEAVAGSEKVIRDGKADKSIIDCEKRNACCFYEILNTKNKRKLRGGLRELYLSI